jgi:DNA polymerase-3 subunit alpha
VSPHPKVLPDGEKPERRFGDHDSVGNKLDARGRAPGQPRYGDHDAEATKYGGHEHDPPIILRARKTGNLKPMRFVSLHHHSTYSYLDGYQLPDAHVRRAIELNMGAMALTEHGNIDSHVKFETAARKMEWGGKPLFGCEFYMPTGPNWFQDGDGERNPNARSPQTQRKHHLTVIARTPEGYRNLCRLITLANQNFYHDPLLAWPDLLANKEGLVVLSGCSGSLLFCSGVGGKDIQPEEASYQRALRVARAFRREFGDSYFIEVQAFPELESTRRWCAMAPRVARAVGAKLVGTLDCHYVYLEESEVQQMLHGLRPGQKQTLEERARDWGYNVPLCPPPNDNTVYRKLRACGLSKTEAIEAIVSTEEIAKSCTVQLPKLPMVRYPLPPGYATAIELWRDLLREGWKMRGLNRRPRSEREKYKQALADEMKLIEDKDFVDYFLLVRHGVVQIKDEGHAVGPARGSAAASVAAWLLRITEVDPLRPEFAGLLRFDRFISVDRRDLPDIDLDFPSEARPRLRQIYVDLMGGADRVNNVGTFMQFKGKNSLDDTARVFRVPQFEVNRIKDFLIERSSGDMRASSTVWDTIAQFDAAREVVEKYPELRKADLLEGNVKAFGVHAAALVLSNEPITNVTAVIEREVPKGSANWITCVALDKKDAERQGMVKMDFLGLNTMSMIDRALGWIGKDTKWLYSLPLDDQRVYACLQEVDVTGVFQFEGRAQRYVCSMIKPEKFSEIMDCGALCRPGPLHNGAAKMYGELKQGGRVALAEHPVLEDLLGTTHYQIVYQEQIMQIARVIGNFDDVGVGTIRTIIAKKEGEQAFAKWRERFVEGALTLHKRFPQYPPMSAGVADTVFGDCVTSGAYAFNAAHCAAYGLISYYTAYLKVYYPAVFYASALCESITDGDRTRQLLRDAHHHGVRVLAPDLFESEANWEPVLSSKLPTIRAGLQSIEGIGEKSAATVAEWRDGNRERIAGWGDLKELRGFGAKTVEKITSWLAQEDPFGAFNLDRHIREVKADLEAGRLGDLPKPTHTGADLAADLNAGKKLDVYWLGTVVAKNIRNIFEQNTARGQSSEWMSKHGARLDLDEWAMLTAEDETDQLLLKVDRFKYPTLKQGIFNFRLGRDLLLVHGVKPARSGVRTLHVKKFWIINPEED